MVEMAAVVVKRYDEPANERRGEEKRKRGMMRLSPLACVCLVSRSHVSPHGASVLAARVGVVFWAAAKLFFFVSCLRSDGFVGRFSDNVSCFSFNGDKSKLALCPNNSEIWIYAKNGEEWEEECVLREHTELVTGLDWGVKTNRIVSCSQDRNAYVWSFDNGRWMPTLVILRLQRAATFVAWSPREDKFAVSSGAKLVCICYFEDEHDWWVSKHIKKHRSTVLSVKWHPNNVLVATASSDNRARVFSAWTKGVDKRGAVCPIPDPEKKAETFGECLLEWDAGAWVKDVAWSPSGNLLAFISQDASVAVADVSQGQVPPAVVKLSEYCVVVVFFFFFVFFANFQPSDSAAFADRVYERVVSGGSGIRLPAVSVSGERGSGEAGQVAGRAKGGCGRRDHQSQNVAEHGQKGRVDRGREAQDQASERHYSHGRIQRRRRHLRVRFPFFFSSLSHSL